MLVGVLSYIRVGFALSILKKVGNARAFGCGTAIVESHAFFVSN